MTFRHQALLYRNSDDYIGGVSSAVNTALADGATVTVAVPRPNLDHLCTALATKDAGRIRFVDMGEAGRNPGRIIPELIGGFLAENPEGKALFVGEPIWAARTPAEYAAAIEHEALINLAFEDRDGVTVLCPYDSGALSRRVLGDAERTHPEVIEYGSMRAGFRYTSADKVAVEYNRPLREPHCAVESLAYNRGDLQVVRHFVRTFAEQSKLAEDRITDLCVAVNEVATNTLAHTEGAGQLRCWRGGDLLVCEIRDSGQVSDPLFDRRPAQAGGAGRGLLLVHQLCDLVQIYTHALGLVVRLHMRFS